MRRGAEMGFGRQFCPGLRKEGEFSCLSQMTRRGDEGTLPIFSSAGSGESWLLGSLVSFHFSSTGGEPGHFGTWGVGEPARPLSLLRPSSKLHSYVVYLLRLSLILPPLSSPPHY